MTDPNADPGSIVRGADVVGDNDGLLEVGETWSYTATHTVTQAEIDSNGGGDGTIDNTATADSDQTGPDSADVSVPVEQTPALTIVKEALPGQIADVAGETLNYTITVANTGNTTLTGVVVTDPNANPGSIVLVADAASPMASWTLARPGPTRRRTPSRKPRLTATAAATATSTTRRRPTATRPVQPATMPRCR